MTMATPSNQTDGVCHALVEVIPAVDIDFQAPSTVPWSSRPASWAPEVRAKDLIIAIFGH